jgi:hypothetical protein
VRSHRVKPNGTAFYFMLKYCVTVLMARRWSYTTETRGCFQRSLFVWRNSKRFFNFRSTLRLLLVYINYIYKVRLNTRIFIRQILVRSFASFLRRWQSVWHWRKGVNCYLRPRFKTGLLRSCSLSKHSHVPHTTKLPNVFQSTDHIVFQSSALLFDINNVTQNTALNFTQMSHTPLIRCTTLIWTNIDDL